MKNLPRFPAVALQLMGLLDSDVPVKQVVKLLRMDPALSAEILRVSNSALYGLSRNVDSVSHAVVVLGGDAVKRLALTVSLGRFSQGFMNHAGLRRCWDHSVAVALIAEDLSQYTDQGRDRAYTAGLLHDVGRLALLACFPDEYDNLLAVVQENDFDFRSTELRLFEIDHCSAGEWLCKSWNLPEDITAAIAHHHNDDLQSGSLPALIWASNMVAASMGYGTVATNGTIDVSEILGQAGINSVEAAMARLDSLSERISESIAVISSPR
jgi:putative nucleotidyltransferase with HDIG domain